MLRITTDKEVKRLNQEFKNKDDEIAELKIKLEQKNKILRDLYRITSEYQLNMMLGGAAYRQILRQIKNKIEENVEKKFADEILPHFTSTNQK